MKHAIRIISLILVAVGLGYAYEVISIGLQKNAHPLKYTEIVEKYAEEYSVPKEIIYAVINAESSFDSGAVSSAGAVGLMQLMPNTYKDIQRLLGEQLEDGLIYDPETNIRYGTYFLRYLYSNLNDWPLTYAAYNAGLSRVKNEWMQNPEYIENGVIKKIPFTETKNYIDRVTKGSVAYKKLYFTEPGTK
ncbi:lytic transglycosylase [Clostridia bacterium]|nr:lytic transglycosylase [Clostridia bacterium]GHV12342.1 lytic transglycosylase [Clostridia bacterium]